MNGNVKIVNNTLQMVSFQQVRMGWIQGMSLNPDSKDEIFTLDNMGIIYVNTDVKYADEYARWMIAVKGIPSRLLDTEEGFTRFLKAIATDEILNSTLKVKIRWKESMKKAWVAACKYETMRREVRKKFMKKYWWKYIFVKFLKFLKGGEKYGKYNSIN